MSRKMGLIFNHQLNDEQIKDAKENLNVEIFHRMTDSLQKKFSQVPADLKSLNEYAEDFYIFILLETNENDYILVQGDVGLTHKIVSFCKIHNRIPVYATTKRDTIEFKNEDGSVSKKSIFKHIIFRKYE